MPISRPALCALLPVALLPAACATFDGVLRSDEFERAQERVETDDELRRLLAAYAPGALQAYVAPLDRDAAIAAFRAGAGRSSDELAFEALLDRYLFVALLADTRRTRLHEGVRWTARGKAYVLRGFDDASDFVSLTGEPGPDACRHVTEAPLAPGLAPFVNLAARGAADLKNRVLDDGRAGPSRAEPMQEHARTIEVCPTAAEHARVAPRAAALSAALRKPAEAAGGGSSASRIAGGVAVAFARPVDGRASVVMCTYARSWQDRAQLAVRYEIPVDEASLPRAGELVPIERVAPARGAVLVTEARELFDGDPRAAECLEPALASPALAARIRALQERGAPASGADASPAPRSGPATRGARTVGAP